MAKKKSLTVKFDNNFITAILYILVGILCVAFRAQMLELLLTIIGTLFIVQGVLGLLKSDWINAAINLVIGIVIIVFSWTIIDLVLIVFGVLIVIKGIQELVKVSKKDVIGIVAAAITVVVGVLLFVAKWVLADWIFIVIGIVFIVNGVAQLIDKM